VGGKEGRKEERERFDIGRCVGRAKMIHYYLFSFTEEG